MDTAKKFVLNVERSIVSTLQIRRSRLRRILVLASLTYLLHVYVHNVARVVIGVELRILAIGDSLTWGFGSTDWNSFRGPLLGELIGDVAYFVGSQQTGEMYYNYHEGRPGQRLNTTLANVAWALTERPNVILIHLGSNDIVYSDNIETAPQRMDLVLEGVWQSCPDATILVARIGPINHTEFAVKYEQFNDNVAMLVEAWKKEDAHILMLDLTKGLDIQQHFVDNTHPNDVGYRIMARQWYNGILDAHRRGWIKPPVPFEEIEAIFYGTQDGSVHVGGLANDPQTGDWQAKLEHQYEEGKSSEQEDAQETEEQEYLRLEQQVHFMANRPVQQK